MKQQWTNPLLSMLASTAMCAILSFNQPTLRSLDNNDVAFQPTSYKEVLTLASHSDNLEVEQQLEQALSLELFASEQKLNKSSLSNQQELLIQIPKQAILKQVKSKQECNQRTSGSVRTSSPMPMVRNNNLI